MLDDDMELPIYRLIDDYYFLSNFSPAKVVLPAEEKFNLPAMEFDTLENGYMAFRTVDLEVRKHIQSIKPNQAKRMSINKDIPIRKGYTDSSRFLSMVMLVNQKFSNLNPQLIPMILATKNRRIIEGNWHNDTFFGFCLKTGKGHDYLGLIIENRRKRLMQDQLLSVA